MVVLLGDTPQLVLSGYDIIEAVERLQGCLYASF
jgi:hypothetical protein